MLLETRLSIPSRLRERRRWCRRLRVAAMGWITAVCLFGASDIRALEDLVHRFEAKAGIQDHTPGIAVLITRDGKILFQHYRGISDLRSGTPIQAETPFRLASVSKPFTALAVQQLVEQKRMEAGLPVLRYLPDFPWPEITVHHLLTHTSGLPEYTAFTFFRTKVENSDVLRALRGKQLDFSPGSQSRYSNTNYAILALLVEAVSQQTFANYLHQHIFQPAGLRNAYLPGHLWEEIPGRAVGYQRLFQRFLPMDSDSLNGIVGALGVYASARDVDRWLTALHQGRLCRHESLHQATTTASPDSRGLPYGYGWLVTRFAHERVIWHNGNWLGFDSFVARLEREKINIVLLSNSGYKGRRSDLADDLGFPLLEEFIVPR